MQASALPKKIEEEKKADAEADLKAHIGTDYPSKKTFAEWKKEISAETKEVKNAARTFEQITPAQAREHVYGRKLWTDAVSKTYKLNEKESKDCKKAVLERINKLIATGEVTTEKKAEDIYSELIQKLQKDTAITFAFDAKFLQTTGLTNHQVDNLFERNTSKCLEIPNYKKLRDKAERKLFDKITSWNTLFSKSSETFLDNPHSRPRYAIYCLLDSSHAVQQSGWYGDSFLYLKEVMKLNSLFAPSDTYNNLKLTKKSYRLCTWHHFEVLLAQCSDSKFKCLVEWVTKNTLNYSGYDTYSGLDCGYVEVLVPSIDFFDHNQVQLVHVKVEEVKEEQKSDKEELKAIKEKPKSIKDELEVFTEKTKITFSVNTNPYAQTLFARFESKLATFNPGPKEQVAIERIKKLFFELEAKKVPDAEKIILGCWVHERDNARADANTDAKNDRSPKLFKSSPASEFGKKLNELLNLNFVQTPAKEAEVFACYWQYGWPGSEVKLNS